MILITIKKFTSLLLILLAVMSCSHNSQDRTDPLIIAYYVPGKNYDPKSVPVEKLTHIIFSFTHVIDGQMKFRYPDIQDTNLLQLIAQKSRNPGLKIMIACGGWGADGFSDMALTYQSREKFILSVTKFIKKYDMDGIDIDWEYPSISGAGTKARIEDKQNFTHLMQELRIALDALDKPQTLTFASAGWQHYYDNIELGPVMQVSDFMNVMTYDQVSGVSIITGHHTPLGAVSIDDIAGTPMANNLDSISEVEQNNGWTTDSDPRSIEKIVEHLISNGVKANQLVVGAAFYGRAWKGVLPERNGLYQVSNGIHIGWLTYRQIREEFESDSTYKRYWDAAANAPYYYNEIDSIMISYDDTVSVRLKMEYATQKELGGVMFWELGYDTKDGAGLLDAIYSAAN